MSKEHDRYFQELEGKLRTAGLKFDPSKRTDSGRNVFVRRTGTGELLEVTANYAPTRNRISCKLTINRGTKGAYPKLFKKLESDNATRAAELEGAVSWESFPERSESRVQVERGIKDFASIGEMAAWAVTQIKWLIALAKSA